MEMNRKSEFRFAFFVELLRISKKSSKFAAELPKWQYKCRWHGI